jgi:hypothetical protein
LLRFWKYCQKKDRRYYDIPLIGTSSSDILCDSCSGTIGAGRSSRFVFNYRRMLITSHGLFFNTDGNSATGVEIFQNNPEDGTIAIPCSLPSSDLCPTLIDVYNLTDVELRLSPEDPFTYVPYSVWSILRKGKNIQTPIPSQWDDFCITFKGMTSERLEICIPPHDFVKLESSPRLLIRPHSENYIRFGHHVLRQIQIGIDTDRDLAYILKFPQRPHFSNFTLVILVLIIFLYRYLVLAPPDVFISPKDMRTRFTTIVGKVMLRIIIYAVPLLTLSHLFAFGNLLYLPLYFSAVISLAGFSLIVSLLADLAYVYTIRHENTVFHPGRAFSSQFPLVKHIFFRFGLLEPIVFDDEMVPGADRRFNIVRLNHVRSTSIITYLLSMALILTLETRSAAASSLFTTMIYIFIFNELSYSTMMNLFLIWTVDSWQWAIWTISHFTFGLYFLFFGTRYTLVPAMRWLSPTSGYFVPIMTFAFYLVLVTIQIVVISWKKGLIFLYVKSGKQSITNKPANLIQ